MKKPKPEAKAKETVVPVLPHRPIDEIKREIANSPAQALPALQAELAAALDAERKG